MDPRKAYGLLGLAARKRSVLSGGGVCERFLRDGKGAGPGAAARGRSLVLVAADASEQSRERIGILAQKAGATLRVFGDKASLGAHIGKAERSAAIVTDESLAAALLQKIDDG